MVLAIIRDCLRIFFSVLLFFVDGIWPFRRARDVCPADRERGYPRPLSWMHARHQDGDTSLCRYFRPLSGLESTLQENCVCNRLSCMNCTCLVKFSERIDLERFRKALWLAHCVDSDDSLLILRTCLVQIEGNVHIGVVPRDRVAPIQLTVLSAASAAVDGIGQTASAEKSTSNPPHVSLSSSTDRLEGEWIGKELNLPFLVPSFASRADFHAASTQAEPSLRLLCPTRFTFVGSSTCLVTVDHRIGDGIALGSMFAAVCRVYDSLRGRLLPQSVSEFAEILEIYKLHSLPKGVRGVIDATGAPAAGKQAPPPASRAAIVKSRSGTDVFSSTLRLSRDPILTSGPSGPPVQRTVPTIQDLVPFGIKRVVLVLFRLLEILSGFVSIFSLPVHVRYSSHEAETETKAAPKRRALSWLYGGRVQKAASPSRSLCDHSPLDKHRSGVWTPIHRTLVETFTLSTEESEKLFVRAKAENTSVGALLLTCASYVAAMDRLMAGGVGAGGARSDKIRRDLLTAVDSSIWGQMVVDYRRFVPASHHMGRGIFLSVVDCLFRCRLPMASLLLQLQQPASGERLNELLAETVRSTAFQRKFWHDAREMKKSIVWTAQSGGLYRSVIFIMLVNKLTNFVGSFRWLHRVTPSFCVSNLGVVVDADEAEFSARSAETAAARRFAGPERGGDDRSGNGRQQSRGLDASSLSSQAASSATFSMPDHEQSIFNAIQKVVPATTCPVTWPYFLLTTATASGRLSCTLSCPGFWMSSEHVLELADRCRVLLSELASVRE